MCALYLEGGVRINLIQEHERLLLFNHGLCVMGAKLKAESRVKSSFI